MGLTDVDDMGVTMLTQFVHGLLVDLLFHFIYLFIAYISVFSLIG